MSLPVTITFGPIKAGLQAIVTDSAGSTLILDPSKKTIQVMATNAADITIKEVTVLDYEELDKKGVKVKE